MNLYGWRKDPHDRRDWIYSAGPEVDLPRMVDLRMDRIEIFQQKNQDCVANATAAAIQRIDPMHFPYPDPYMPPSRRWIYYQARKLGGLLGGDGGCYIRDAIKSVNSLGVCCDSMWPYLPGNIDQEPTGDAYDAAALHQALAYERVTDLYSMRHCLANWVPFVFGIPIWPSFESPVVARTGVVPMPDTITRGVKTEIAPSVGGHAMLAVGYSDELRVFFIQNSWGEAWGDHGYCYIPYDYLDSWTDADSWAITRME